MTEAPPEISVSIVSYNTRDLLRECLASVLAREAAGEACLEIIVADNGSTDGSVEMVREQFPTVHLRPTGGNIGYGRANNAALENATGRYFFVLNSDTEIKPGALSTMRDFMDSHPDVGAAGAQLVLPNGTTQPSCATDPSLMAVFWEQTYLDKLLPGNRVTGAYAMTHWAYNDARAVEQVAGACLFVRREAYQAIGGFDPAYFMYFEDTDFCIRLRRAGWPIWFVPSSRIGHHLGASSGDWRIRARMIASYNQSRYYFYTRYGGRGRGLVLKGMVLIGAGLRLAGWSLLSVARPGARKQVRLFASVLAQTLRMTPFPHEKPNERSHRQKPPHQ